MDRRPAGITIAQLRKALAKEEAGWTINRRFKDGDAFPRFSTGGTAEGLIRASAIRPLDFKKLLRRGTANPWLAAARIVRGFGASEMAPPPRIVPRNASGPAPSRSVDWRNRWGWPWITTARDQNPCPNCWAFTATALVESMTRIEHAVWSPRSEADLLNSVTANCNNSGNWAMGLNGIEKNGIADRDCVPWVPMVTTYQPTADRGGRTVRIPDWEYVGSVNDQKDWLENVGPLATSFYVWKDFMVWGAGVYKKSSVLKPVVDERGWHALLVVGFDDTQGAWIVKNSWGNGWGVNGFGLVGYGECEIDSSAKAGLQGTDPDPWTKRRLHNGNILEGDNGDKHNDFEMLAAFAGDQLRHWRRENSSGHVWQGMETFASDVSLFRPTLIQSTYNRNYEAVYLTYANRLRHWWFSRNAQRWFDGGIFGPPDAAGIPGFIQSNYGAPGNFEVVVRTADGRLSQWWRTGGSGGGWVDGGKFGGGVAFSGASLIQSSYGQKGDFFLVCTLNSGEMQEWRRDNDLGTGWSAGPKFGNGIISPPCMIESQYGASTENHVGNFELCVAANGQVQHWWRANWNDQTWRFGGSFGHDVFAVTGLMQSSYGFALEVIVLRYDFNLQHYWRSVSGWHEGPIVGSAA
jgi:hypothetical protein